MNYIPGEFVRRAAANVTSISSTVSGAVSSVAQVASGKKKHEGGDSMLSNAKEKYSLMLKCTPNKDAATTANLAVKSGFLLKRNEQGNWQKRFVCIVPHMFLYYFDNELAETPRGVIDLELYTEVYREDGLLRLGTNDEEILRSFYFDDDDKDNLNDWSSSLTRDRYHTVREERNAYQQMQFEMTGAIDDVSKRHKDSIREREQLEQRLIQAEQYCSSSKSVLQSVLVELGVTDEDMVNLSEINRVGVSLKQRINDLRHSYDTRIDELFEELKAEKADRQKDVDEINRKLEQEQLSRKNLEALIFKERKEAEKKIKEAESQVDNVTMNFQMAVAGKSTAEAKSNTLSEQKKLLVKEVKQLRKKLDDSNTSIEDLKTMNDRLVKAAQILQMKLKTALQVNAAVIAPSAGEVPSDGGVHTSQDQELRGPTEGDGTVNKLPSDDDMQQEDIDLLLRQSGEFSASLLVAPLDVSGHDIHSDHLAIEEEEKHNEQLEPRKLSNSTNNDEEERMSWDMPQTQLRELGWLTAEQSKMMEKRGEKINHHANAGSRSTSPAPVASAFKQSDDALKDYDHNSANSQRRGSTLSLFSSVLGTTNDSSEVPTHSTPEPQNNRRSSLSMISSMFTSKSATPSSTKKDDHSDHNEPFTTKSETGKPFFSSPLDEEDSNDERLPTAMRLQCLRCKGTVEGPKFSTCKCAIPALTPDDVPNNGGTLNILSGMLSKSSSVAGGLAGGLMKATAVTASSVTGLVNYSSHGHSSHSGTTSENDESVPREDILL